MGKQRLNWPFLLGLCGKGWPRNELAVRFGVVRYGVGGDGLLVRVGAMRYGSAKYDVVFGVRGVRYKAGGR